MAFIHYFATIQTDSGTWTTLATPTTDIDKSDPNAPRLLNIAQSDLQNVPVEFEQFVTLVSKGYNIGYWPALCLVEKMVLALKNRSNLPI